MKLKPCPFCGSLKIYLGNQYFAGINTTMYFMSCKDCYACGSYLKNTKDVKQKAIKAWNTRKEALNV